MTINSLPLRQGAVLASAVIYWSGVVIHARHLRQRIGQSPNIKPRGSKEMALWFGWFIVIAGWIGQPLIMRTSRGGALFSLASVFVGPPSLFCGALVALCGHLGTLWCYSALGDSWRIGVMRDEKTTLVTHGPYRLVRHPIYLFQFMILVGMLVLLPSLFSILILFIHFICVILKSFDEERHLAAIHDCKYHDYLLRTGGFFPRWKSILLVLGIRKKS